MLGLAELVQNLRSELQSAVAAGADDALVFEVGEIELQLSVAVTRETGGSGKVRFWVIELGGEGKSGAASTQQITLKLTPKFAATGRSPEIDDAAMPAEGSGPASR